MLVFLSPSRGVSGSRAWLQLWAGVTPAPIPRWGCVRSVFLPWLSDMHRQTTHTLLNASAPVLAADVSQKVTWLSPVSGEGGWEASPVGATAEHMVKGTESWFYRLEKITQFTIVPNHTTFLLKGNLSQDKLWKSHSNYPWMVVWKFHLSK